MPEPEDRTMHRNGHAVSAWEEANAWLLRERSGLMSTQEREEFAAWRHRDSAHESQFRQAEQFWSALDGLADRVSRHPPAVQSIPTPLALPSATAVSPGSRFKTLSRWPVTMAATIVFIVLASVLWSSSDVWLSDYRTHTGEQTSVSLADGSVVHLNTRSALSVDLSDQRRALSLKQGEALFEVAHDPSRPFEVAVNGSIVRAIGTAFNIEYRDTHTTVSVVEGVVRLFYSGVQRDISAGYRLTYTSGESLGELEPIDGSRVTAWRHREFVFDDLPLEQIVQQLNQYRTGPIVIVNSQLRTRRLSGSVALDDPDHSLSMLQQVVPFHIVHLTSYLTLVTL